MFHAAEEIQAEIFAVLPDAYRRANRQTDWSAARRGGRAVHSFLEGPSFDREGNLYVTDIPFGRIFRVSAAGEWSLVTEYDGEPNGLKIHRDGRGFITDFRHGIVELDLRSGATRPVLARRHTEHFKGVNDLFFAANGDMYFTDQGRTGHHDPTGRVYRWTADGQLHLLLATGVNPNGLVTSADERVLYVAMTNANAVWHLNMLPDGEVASAGTFIQLSGGAGPDGLALTEDGGLAVVHAGVGIVWVFDGKGQPRYRVKTAGGDHVTNVAFGGPDNKTLYITEATDGTVQRAQLPVAGRRMFSHT